MREINLEIRYSRWKVQSGGARSNVPALVIPRGIETMTGTHTRSPYPEIVVPTGDKRQVRRKTKVEGLHTP